MRSFLLFRDSQPGLFYDLSAPLFLEHLLSLQNSWLRSHKNRDVIRYNRLEVAKLVIEVDF